jgi:hypothetical protein
LLLTEGQFDDLVNLTFANELEPYPRMSRTWRRGVSGLSSRLPPLGHARGTEGIPRNRPSLVDVLALNDRPPNQKPLEIGTDRTLASSSSESLSQIMAPSSPGDTVFP